MHLDVMTAFLSGEIKENIYMEQLPELEKSEQQLRHKLQGNICGLKQSARGWKEKFELDAPQGRINTSQNRSPVVLKEEKVNSWTCILIYADVLIPER